MDGHSSSPADHDAQPRAWHHPREHDGLRQVAPKCDQKKFEAGVIRDPITVDPQTRIRRGGDAAHATPTSPARAPVVEGEQLANGIVSPTRTCASKAAFCADPSNTS